MAGLGGGAARGPGGRAGRRGFRCAWNGSCGVRGGGRRDLVRTWVQVPDILGPAGSVQRVRGGEPGAGGGFRAVWTGGGWSGEATREASDSTRPARGSGLVPGDRWGWLRWLLRDGGGELERVALENPRQVPAYRYGR
ncbi:MAG: hypothetical protein KatS3mg132_550 [Limisphaera sp.]|nr:MAG: hypothetical protein KatS3mg132_550 [Limisphaera sp.]